MDPLEKFLRKLDAKMRKRLLQIIDTIVNGETEHWDIKPLTNTKDLFRCRVGDIRIIMRKVAGRYIIYDIHFRGSIYKK
jgi:mRNA-degrading endonuclease RelE of RelBE toxin-antitoxin system